MISTQAQAQDRELSPTTRAICVRSINRVYKPSREKARALGKRLERKQIEIKTSAICARVPSSRGKSTYEVVLKVDGYRCTCPFHKEEKRRYEKGLTPRGRCKHVAAVAYCLLDR